MRAARNTAMTVVALLALTGLYAALVRQERETDRRGDEANLRASLTLMRSAIAEYRRENGRHPKSLAELVPRYLQAIPRDPITGSAGTWKVTTEVAVPPNSDFSTSTAAAETFVIDVHSGAGAPYSGF